MCCIIYYNGLIMREQGRVELSFCIASGRCCRDLASASLCLASPLRGGAFKE